MCTNGVHGREAEVVSGYCLSLSVRGNQHQHYLPWFHWLTSSPFTMQGTSSGMSACSSLRAACSPARSGDPGAYDRCAAYWARVVKHRTTYHGFILDRRDLESSKLGCSHGWGWNGVSQTDNIYDSHHLYDLWSNSGKIMSRSRWVKTHTLPTLYLYLCPVLIQHLKTVPMDLAENVLLLTAAWPQLPFAVLEYWVVTNFVTHGLLALCRFP